MIPPVPVELGFPLAVRLTVVLLSLLLTPMTILLYLIVGLIAPQD